MKAVILAGGLGTRISEETSTKPKPMIEIGGKPIIWHIMKMYSTHGINDFVICCGYKGYLIKEYFANYLLHMSDVTINVAKQKLIFHHKRAEDWKVTLVDTGEHSETGGRLMLIKEYLGDDDFCFTYGDGVSDIDISQLIEYHKSHKKLATVTAVQPQGRFGALEIEGNAVKGFHEKPIGDGGWINGGFFVLNPKVISEIENELTIWEQKPLESLAIKKDLMAYIHKGFWHPMDTLRDKNHLEHLWSSNKAPWKTWE